MGLVEGGAGESALPKYLPCGTPPLPFVPSALRIWLQLGGRGGLCRLWKRVRSSWAGSLLCVCIRERGVPGKYIST